jgi:transposase
MNSSLYQQLLTTHLTPHISKLHHNFFYQDNIPLHKTPNMLAWFEDNGLELIDIPSYSPEFNAIEYVWSWLKKYVQTQQPKTQTELEQAIDLMCAILFLKRSFKGTFHIFQLLCKKLSMLK